MLFRSSPLKAHVVGFDALNETPTHALAAGPMAETFPRPGQYARRLQHLADERPAVPPAGDAK
jgi:hypothetical protein